MNASPLYPRHEIPLLGVVSFPTDSALRVASLQAARTFLFDDFQPQIAAEFHIRQPKVVEGVVASGDRFFASREDRVALQEALPGVACVEMEGAAVAQVCHEYAVPAVVIRTISDSADEGAPADFPNFVRQIASAYSHGILKRLLPILRHHSTAGHRPT
jgi:adenosylhomocysteine nucleosidase